MGIFKSTIGKLKKGLTRTRETFAGGLRSLLAGRKIDEQLIGELERRLIESDVGVVATRRLIAGIREDVKAGELTRGEDVLAYMKRDLKAMWPQADRRLREADAGVTVILVMGSDVATCRVIEGPQDRGGDPAATGFDQCCDTDFT